jgi:hypothetical protein
MNARLFQLRFAPILAANGYPRDSYELVCVVREPVDWVASWWRFLSRPELAHSPKYVGHLGFEDFADRVINGQIRVGNIMKFVTDSNGDRVPATLFRYDRIDAAAASLASRVGMRPPLLRSQNRSPARPLVIARSTRRRLESHLGAHAALYDEAV